MTNKIIKLSIEVEATEAQYTTIAQKFGWTKTIVETVEKIHKEEYARTLKKGEFTLLEDGTVKQVLKKEVQNPVNVLDFIGGVFKAPIDKEIKVLTEEQGLLKLREKQEKEIEQAKKKIEKSGIIKTKINIK